MASKKELGGESRPISGFSGITADEKIDLETSDVVDGKQSDVVENVVPLDVKSLRGLMKMSESTAVVESILFELAEETNDVCILGLREAVGRAELKMLFVVEVELAEEEAKELR